MPIDDGLELRLKAFINARIDGFQAHRLESGQDLSIRPFASHYMADAMLCFDDLDDDLFDAELEINSFASVATSEDNTPEPPKPSPKAKISREKRRRQSSYAELDSGDSDLSRPDQIEKPEDITPPSIKEYPRLSSASYARRIETDVLESKRPSFSLDKADMSPAVQNRISKLDPEKDFVPEESFRP